MNQKSLKSLLLCGLLAFSALVHTPKAAEAHGSGLGWGIAAGIATGIILNQAYRHYPSYYGPSYYGGGYYGGYPSYYAAGYPYYGGYYYRPRYREYRENYYSRHLSHGYGRPYFGYHHPHH